MKMIFFDIDGTIIDDKTHVVPQSTIQALTALKNNGHKIFVSTGRSYPMVKEMNIHTIADWDGYVCNNGQIVVDSNGKILQGLYLESHTVEQLLQIASKNSEPLYLHYDTGSALFGEIDDNMIAAHDYFRSPLPTNKDVKTDGVIMALAYREKENSYSEYCEVPGVELFKGVGTWADIVRVGTTKQLGIQFLLDYFKQDTYIAFGDSANDIEMLKRAEIGIAMGNGIEEVKEVADYVTDAVSDNGIYNACIHFKLI